MAKQRLSNEVIAQVLTQVVEDLRKDLNKHSKLVQEMSQRKIEVKTDDFLQLVKENKRIMQNYADEIKRNQEELRKSIESTQSGLKFTLILSWVAFFVVAILFYFS